MYLRYNYKVVMMVVGLVGLKHKTYNIRAVHSDSGRACRFETRCILYEPFILMVVGLVGLKQDV